MIKGLFRFFIETPFVILSLLILFVLYLFAIVCIVIDYAKSFNIQESKEEFGEINLLIGEIVKHLTTKGMEGLKDI